MRLSFRAEKTSRPNCGGCDAEEGATARRFFARRGLLVAVVDFDDAVALLLLLLFPFIFLVSVACSAAPAFPPKNARLEVAFRQASPPKSSRETGANGEAAAAKAALRIDCVTFSRSFLTSSRRLSEDLRAALSAGSSEDTRLMSAKERGREGDSDEEEREALLPNRCGDVASPSSSLFSRRRPARRRMAARVEASTLASAQKEERVRSKA